MRRSESIAALSAALALAAGQFRKVHRDRTARVRTRAGSEYSYDFADLESVLDGVRAGLTANGLAITFDCETIIDPSLRVTTRATLWHASGEWLESSPLTIPCSSDMAPPQAIGSACTYGKRYCVQNLLGISTDRDEDGTAAGGNVADVSARKNASAQEKRPAAPQMHKPLAEFLAAFGWPPEAKARNAQWLIEATGSTVDDCVRDTRAAVNTLAALTTRLNQLNTGDLAAARQQLFDEARLACEGSKPAKATSSTQPAPTQQPDNAQRQPAWAEWQSAPLIAWLDKRVSTDAPTKTRQVKALLSPWGLAAADLRTIDREKTQEILDSLNAAVAKLEAEGLSGDDAVSVMIRAAEGSND